jgi:hypothetical protein
MVWRTMRRAGHCAYKSKTHEEMADALLDYQLCLEDLLSAFHGLAIVVLGFVTDDKFVFVFGQGIRMDRSLRNQAVGQRDTDDAGDETCSSEKSKVPVESCRLLEGILSGLSTNTADVMIIVEKQGHEDTDR